MKIISFLLPHTSRHEVPTSKPFLAVLIAFFLTGCVVMQNEAPETGAVYSEQRCYYDAIGVYNCSVCYGSECAYGRPVGNKYCYYTADSTVICEIYQPQVQWHMHVYQDPFPPSPPRYYRRHRGRPDDYPEPPPRHKR